MIKVAAAAGGELKKAVGGESGIEWAKSDTRAFRRLVLGQNLSFLRQGFDVLEEEVNSAIGVK
jgi:hypothetical protein